MTEPKSSCCGAATGIIPTTNCSDQRFFNKRQCAMCGKACEVVDKETPKPDSKGCKTASYSIFTDEERRQTYDYKMGYREGMMEAKKMVKLQMMNEASDFGKAWNEAVRWIVHNIEWIEEKKICQK